MTSTESPIAVDLAANPLGLVFTNRFTRDLPADPVEANHRRAVHQACFSRVLPTPTAAPTLIAHSREVADQLGLDPDTVASPEFAEVFNGNLVSSDMDPYAMAYGGHQFGGWSGQLGDGRAIALGEVLATDGSFQTLQLKGSGPTPYSRGGDGRAVLRSSVREFLCSEAMFHLGIPTTRALSLTLSGDQVERDMFYDGRPAMEPGAVVCRVAPSFLRFGNYELFASRGDLVTLRTLVDWTIRTDFAALADGLATDEPLPPEAINDWFAEIVRRTADMIVNWMRVGFVHGVMNTDNLSVLGLTIDYGPYGWLEGFEPDWTPNTTDAQGRRYRYGNQPAIAHWNLVQLANAIAPLHDPEADGFEQRIEPIQTAIEDYGTRFDRGWSAMMARRLGLAGYDGQADTDLFGELGRILQISECDMTIFHRRLADIDVAAVRGDVDGLDDAAVVAPIAQAWYGEPLDRAVAEMAGWIRDWAARVDADGRATGDAAAARLTTMAATNPKYVLRNWMAQLAIDRSEAGDHGGVTDLLELVRRPYDEQPDHEAEYFVKRPEWARERAGCSMLSCSS